MDYSVNGILVMLQDLQRIHFGKITMSVNVYVFDESGPMVNTCIFDKDDEPHNFNFYSYEGEEKHKEEYIKVLGYVNENTAA